jgi:uncharacterized protein (DUF1499 family)
MKNGIVRMVFWVLVIIAVAMLAYIRLAPSNGARWNTPIVATADKDMKGGAIRVLSAEADSLARIDAIARTLPRTSVLAGSVEEGRVTYVTRSAIIGFPDYTTVEQDGDTLRMFARLRFGRADFGVNRARLRQLAAGLD